MMQRFSAQNLGCLKDVNVRLTPLHAFVGPNDSGKSTLLRAIWALAESVRQPNGAGFFYGAFPDRMPPEGVSATVTAYDQDGSVLDGCVMTKASVSRHSKRISDDGMSSQHPFSPDELTHRLTAIRGAYLLRPEPIAMRATCKAITSPSEICFTNASCNGLAAVYDALRERDLDAYLSIKARVGALFHHVREVRPITMASGEKVLEAVLHDGTRVSADAMSEGLLYFLAFSALEHLDRRAILCVEEPETGLHPSRIREVIGVLRHLSEACDMQVLMATHSPLVVNELHPTEVSVVTRTVKEGTRVTPLVDTPNFSRRSSVYALGELWVSYANGDLEQPLLEGTATP